MSEFNFNARATANELGRSYDVVSLWSFSVNTAFIDATGFPYHGFDSPHSPVLPVPQNYKITIPYNGGSNNPGSQATTEVGIIGFCLNGVPIYGPSAANGHPQGYPLPPAGYNYNASYGNSQKLGYSFGSDLAGGTSSANPDNQHGIYAYRDYSFLTAWESGSGGVTGSTNFSGLAEVNRIPYLEGSLTHEDGHSKILGFALDGYPIYGPFGYGQQLNPTSTVSRMTSGYQLKSPLGRTGAATDLVQFPAGIFIQDYEFVGGGTLDEHNGRYCVTPDFPQGTYAYFITIDEIRKPVFPYIIGNTYYGTPYSSVGPEVQLVTVPTEPSNLQWITAPTTIANFAIGIYGSYKLLAIDDANRNATLIYQVIDGELPNGVTLNPFTGEISGTPVYAVGSNNYFVSQDYEFTVRLFNGNKTASSDRTFKIILLNAVDKNLQWLTAGGDLGTVPAGTFYQLPLQVVDTQANAASIVYSHISGELPPGMQVDRRGYFQGVPTLLESIAVNASEEYRFTIRAKNPLGLVRDQGFTLTVTNVYGPVIRPDNVSLGTIFDGTYYSQELNVVELNPNVQITWSNIGPLPPGIELNPDGSRAFLTGYVTPKPNTSIYGLPDYDPIELGATGEVIAYGKYDKQPYDFETLNQTVSYDFTIQAYDGANYDLQRYILNVVGRSSYTADNANVTVDVSTITVDAIDTYIPVLLNRDVTTLPTARSGSYYAYKFEGYDFQGDIITYALTENIGTFDAYVLGLDAGFDYGGTVGFDHADPDNLTSLTKTVAGLTLDPSTGWIYGKLDPQSTSLVNYKFGVVVTKSRVDDLGNVVGYASRPQVFTLPVISDANNIIDWITPSNLGAIDNGKVSEITLEAVSYENKTVVYRLVDLPDSPIRLPQGLELMPSGRISGRVSYEAFSLDEFATTFDRSTTTIDRSFTFTVEASSDDAEFNEDGSFKKRPSTWALRQFTLTVNIIDQEPYDNLYLRAMPRADQLAQFNNLVTNTNIFVPNLIYRPDDPWFGVANKLQMLFLPGLNPATLDAYAIAMANNHYTKEYNFGQVKTAIVLDNNFKVRYEVVYVEVIDPELNGANQGPPLEINLNGIIINPYIDENGNEYKIVHPSTSNNMTARIVSGIGYYDQSSLPDWMTSNQPGDTANTFSVPLGYTRGIVLAYAKPGGGNLIAYRLRNSGFNFNTIKFTVDRYFLDNFYSKNWNITKDRYNLPRETTFDNLPTLNIGTIASTVDYAVSVPFDYINGRTVENIIATGAIDGAVGFQDGDTLVFTKQENFGIPRQYDGWSSYVDGFIGDNTLTDDPEGYDSEAYDAVSIIPGYLEKEVSAANVAVVVDGITSYQTVYGTNNKRGGIWRIKIVGETVQLQFVKEIFIGQRVRVMFGRTFGGSIMYYDINMEPSYSVPAYFVYRVPIGTVKKTTFNGGSTRFFSYRDQYYEPGQHDKYVKFPQYGVFT